MRRRPLWFTLSVLGAVGPTLVAQSYPLDAIDPPRSGEFPGGRGRDEMIICTPAGGFPSTGTNVLGTEAIVEDGVVVHLGGNDSAIPQSGYVVSGNGRAQRWIVQHFNPGTPVVHDAHTVRVDESFVGQRASLRWRLGRMAERLEHMPASEEARAQIRALAQAVEAAEDSLTAPRGAAEVLERAIFEAELAAMPSPANEVRAVWLRLDSASPEYIRALVRDLSDTHVNAIFPEVDYGSVAIFPDPTGLYPQHADFEGSDPLATLIEECHARGIQVHAWVHNFFLGGKAHSEYPERWAAAHPEWVSVNRRGESELVPWGYMYKNPTHRDLQDALINAHVALVSGYDLDGYHFDHIRYCLSLSWESGWDYSEHTRARVREELDFDPLDVTPDADPDRWQQWLDWRQEQVTAYVRRTCEALLDVRPDLFISAAVFPDLSEAIENKGQNWGLWADEGLLHAAIPMSYTPDTGEVRHAVSELAREVPAGDPVVIGLGPYLGFHPRLLVEQIAGARSAGATGTCLFAWHRLGPEHRRALVRGPWRSPGPVVWETEGR